MAGKKLLLAIIIIATLAVSTSAYASPTMGGVNYILGLFPLYYFHFSDVVANCKPCR